MLIVTGANGQLGRLVVEALSRRTSAATLGVSVREPERARALAERGVRVRRGDFGDPASLTHAFEGASRVLIISSNTSGDDAVRQHRAAIDAACAAGARRLFYTSHAGASATSLFAPMRDHAATEAALLDCGVPFTSLRNGFYADSALLLFGDAFRTGELVAPEDGPVAWTDHADLAEATALLLSEPEPAGTAANATLTLTGSEALDLGAIAALASTIAGRAIRRVVVSDAEYRDALVARGVPEARAALLLGVFRASRQRDFARVDPTLARCLGRPPTAFREALRRAWASAR